MHNLNIRDILSFSAPKDSWAGLWSELTGALVVGVSSLPESGVAVVAGETASVEELALGAVPLQHIQPLVTEVAHLAAEGGL